MCLESSSRWINESLNLGRLFRILGYMGLGPFLFRVNANIWQQHSKKLIAVKKQRTVNFILMVCVPNTVIYSKS